ncbi:hypothetical protein [Methylosinus sp. R-45379]|uniref:hypothetical protein n=1 Tax=Methylosinus sp. R-45379 TaxID=980563 RepID=UPI0012ED0088|nr:hypothetical protein [Methylosinus sp. R-45379]
MSEITNTADRICGIVTTSGQSISANANAEIKAELDGLAKKLANLGFSAKGNFSTTSYENVIQSELPTTLREVRECKLKIFEILTKKFVESEAKKEINSGYLIPAQDDIPENPCGNITENSVVLLYGSSASIASKFPHSIARINGKSVAIFNMNENGNIYIDLDIESADGRKIVSIIKNSFSINTNNYYSIERPDRSTIIVFDRQKTRVLDVRYLNEKAIRVLGTFRSDGHTIIIEQKSTIVDGFRLSRTCVKSAIEDSVDFNIN